VVVEADPELGLDPPTLVGFENHSGRTFLGEGLRPLGRVLKGNGNNGADGGEGAVGRSIFGTYLHGSLLPKNPHLADLIIARSLKKRLDPLDDVLELAAHRRLVERELAHR
jgi:CobQ-like glutamine amidotransferase family enzyme